MANNQSLVLVEDGVVKGVSKGHRALVFRNGELTTVDGDGQESPAGASAAAATIAIGDATDAQAAEMRDGLKVQSTVVGFLDQFENSTRYPDPTSIVSNTTLPEIGSAWRIHVPAGTAPTVTGRALTPHVNSLFYIGSNVPSKGGKFSLAFEFTASEGSASWANRMGLNISFNAAEMIPADGSAIYPSAGGGIVHINFSDTGITTAASPQFFGGASLTCLNATVSGGIYEWFPGYSGMVAGQRYTILYEVDGDYLRITLVGVGSLLFYHPDLSAHVGAETTNFWWEPNGGTYGTDYRIVPLLHRVWSGSQLDELPSWGSSPPTGLVQQYYFYKGRLRVMGQAIGQTFATGNTPTSADNYFFATPGAARADKGFFSRPFSGYADYSVPLVQNLVTAEISSGTGDSNTNRLSITDFPLTAVGESNAWDVTGSFAANGNTKGVQLYISSDGATLVQTGSITPSGGTWRARFKRVYLTGRTHDFYGEISVTSGGITTVYTGRFAVNSGAGIAKSIHVRLTGTSAGDVLIQQGIWTGDIKPS